MTDLSIETVVVRFRAPWLTRVIASVTYAVGATIVLLLMAIVLVALLGLRGVLASSLTLVAIVLTFLALAIWRFLSQVSSVHLIPNGLVMQRPLGTVQIPYEQLFGIFGVGTSAQSSGTTVVSWMRSILVTAEGPLRLRLSSEDNAALYELLKLRCPWAWGMPPGANLQLPEDAEEMSRQRALDDLDRLIPVVRGAMAGAFIRGSVLLLGMLGLMYVTIRMMRLRTMFWMLFMLGGMGSNFVAAKSYLKTLRQLRQTQQYILEPSSPDRPFAI